jgi:hypothetical protein
MVAARCPAGKKPDLFGAHAKRGLGACDLVRDLLARPSKPAVLLFSMSVHVRRRWRSAVPRRRRLLWWCRGRSLRIGAGSVYCTPGDALDVTLKVALRDIAGEGAEAGGACVWRGHVTGHRGGCQRLCVRRWEGVVAGRVVSMTTPTRVVACAGMRCGWRRT